MRAAPGGHAAEPYRIVLSADPPPQLKRPPLGVPSNVTALTPFQAKTDAALRAALAPWGVALVDGTVQGKSEIYLQHPLGASGVDCFIYEDGAHILGPDVDSRFEAPDYDSLDDLAAAFVNEASAVARRLGPPNQRL